MTEREQSLPVNYGIVLDRIPQVIGKVASLYEEISGIELPSWASHLLDPDHFLRDLRKHEVVEYRFGSKISMHSKLWIKPARDLVYFQFDSNVPRQLWESKGRVMEEEFRQKMNDYLLEAKIGQPLPDYYR